VQEESFPETAGQLIEHTFQIHTRDRSCQSPVKSLEFLPRVERITAASIIQAMGPQK
jgi:hypothetical protein